MAVPKCGGCGKKLPTGTRDGLMCAACIEMARREQEGECDAEMAAERYYEGGWDATGRYAAEEEEDLQRAIAAGNACSACGSVVHVADKDGYCHRTRPAYVSQDEVD
jgi:hypothetical protein